MLVKLLCNHRGSRCGDIVDLPEGAAESLIKRGRAEHAKEEKKIEPKIEVKKPIYEKATIKTKSTKRGRPKKAEEVK